MIKIIADNYKGKINSILEIGSATGSDADFFAKSFDVKENMVHIVEPRKEAALSIRAKYPKYQVHQIACGDENKKNAEFYLSENLEASSLKDRAMPEQKHFHKSKILVDLWRWEDYADSIGVLGFDLVKIDAEGCTYEVLNGLGRYRNFSKVYHLECEDLEFWEKQKMTKDVFDLMPEYEVVWQLDYGGHQLDVIMVRKDCLNDWNKI
jgi:FkbM family methyltransferase